MTSFDSVDPDTGSIRSLGGLPLINGSADPDAEYLSDGISESLINSLSQLPELRVIARTTAFRYKGKEVELISVIDMAQRLESRFRI